MGDIKLMICTPIYGRVPSEFMDCVGEIQANPPCHIMFKRLKGDPVHIARDKLVKIFLETDYTHLLFADSDQVFNGRHILKLLSHDVDIVGASICQKRPDELHWCFKPLHNENDEIITDRNEAGLMEVQAVGTGLTLYKRSVFERIIEKYGDEIWYCNNEHEGTVYEFFPSKIYQYPDGTRQKLGEDFYFCRRWRDMGGKIYADTYLVSPHIGDGIYPMKHQL